MKIILLSPTYPPTKCGMGDYVFKLCQYLAKIYISPHIITSEINQNESMQDSLNVHRIMKNWDLFEIDKIFKLVDKISPQIFHIQYHEEDIPNFDMVHNLPAKLKNKFKNIKIVTSLAYFDLDDKLGFNRVQNLVLNSDSILVTTDFDYNLIIQKFPAQKTKIFKLYDRANIIYNPKINISKKEIRKKFNVSGNETLLINFGFINRNKGLEYIFHSLSQLIEKGFSLKLLIVGELHDGERSDCGKYLQELKDLIKTLKLEKNIILAGHAEENDVSSYLSASDIAVMLFKDGISGKRSSFWSVLDHEIPIITTFSDAQPIPEFLENNKNVILIPVNDVTSLTSAIKNLIENPENCYKIGASGKQLINEKYSWEKLANDINKIYIS